MLPSDTSVADFMRQYPEFDGAELTTMAHDYQSYKMARYEVEWKHVKAVPAELLREEERSTRFLDTIAPLDPVHGRFRWVRVPVGGQKLHPLMEWWGFLFSLSTFARYEPSLWQSALDIDASTDALSLEVALAAALKDLPAILASAVHSVAWRNGILAKE